MRIVAILIVGAAALLPDPAAADVRAAVARATSGDVDARAEVGCAQEVGEVLGTCKAAVARDERSAAVVVTFTNGFARVLMFDDGDFLRGNATMSGVGTDTEWRLSDGVYHVRVDDQRFELPEELVTGN